MNKIPKDWRPPKRTDKLIAKLKPIFEEKFITLEQYNNHVCYHGRRMFDNDNGLMPCQNPVVVWWIPNQDLSFCEQHPENLEDDFYIKWSYIRGVWLLYNRIPQLFTPIRENI